MPLAQVSSLLSQHSPTVLAMQDYGRERHEGTVPRGPVITIPAARILCVRIFH